MRERKPRTCAVSWCIAAPRPGLSHCAAHAPPSERPITCGLCKRTGATVRKLAREAPFTAGVHVCCSGFGKPAGAVLWLL